MIAYNKMKKILMKSKYLFRRVFHDLLFAWFISYTNKNTQHHFLNKYPFYRQDYAGKCLTTGSPGKAESSVGGFCQFLSLWCKFSHRGQFKLLG